MTTSLIPLIAFILGFALSRASSCTVAATSRLVTQGKPDWLLGIMIAASWATLTLFVLNRTFPNLLEMPTSLTPNLTIFLAAVIMGIGAWLNNGCFIGTVRRISSGDLAYLLTFAGLIVSRYTAQFFPQFGPLIEHTEPRMSSTLSPGFWVAMGLVCLLVGWSLWRIFHRRQKAILALSVMGVAAVFLFASSPNWSYESLISKLTSGQGFSENLLLESIVAALFVGAIISSALDNKFKVRFSSARAAALSFVGGIFMGIGSLYVPGGNDTLLLWVIPSFAFHGLFAYVTMVVVVAILEFGSMRLKA